jgi:phosphoribosylformylglycinamidine (FGAM) synthase PurS component
MGANRIEVAFKPGFRVALGKKIAKKVKLHLGLPVKNIHFIKVYLVEGNFSHELLHTFASSALADPVIQFYTIGKPIVNELPCSFDWVLEIGFRPGVTDNEGKVAEEALSYLLGRPLNSLTEGVYYARQYLIEGDFSFEEVERIARDLLANELIERWFVLPASEYQKKGITLSPPTSHGNLTAYR